MKWPFVSRRRYEADLAAVTADRERVRGERDQFRRDRDAHKTAAKTAAEKYTDACIVNECLTEELCTLKEQLAEARALADDSLASQLRAQLKREKRRADRLQKQYDDAVGMGAGRIEDSSRWQPGYKASTEVAS